MAHVAHYAIAVGAGVLAGGALSYLYAKKVIAKVKASVGLVESKASAVKKAL